ncbi:MAG TPA: calcium-binding protein, partial [Roseomonas sp.]|nr:calcium-binding protein [Roseomonas sp.]
LGGNGNDQLNGGSGADSMLGGAGDDFYNVDDPLDRVVEAANGGTDRVNATVSHTLAPDVENLTLGGSGAIAGTGNTLANAMVGNAGANLLSGLDGNDVLQGGGGADTLLGGNGNDNLSGQDGADLLVGGAGFDVLAGGAGADSFRFGAPIGDWDRITDFAAGVDRIEVVGADFGNLLPPGALAAAAFREGAFAVGSDAQFLYDTGTGVLRWDEDGAGGGKSVIVAVLTGAPSLQAGDIWVVS